MRRTCTRERATSFYAAACAALSLCACSQRATSVLLEVRGPTVPPPERLLLKIYEERGLAVTQYLSPTTGSTIRLPETVVLYPPGERGSLRIVVTAEVQQAPVGQGAVRVAVQAGRQESASVTLQAGLLPDGDRDGLPDAVDQCPGSSSSQEAPCGSSGADGGGVVEAGAARDGAPRDAAPRPDLSGDSVVPRPDVRLPDARPPDTRPADRGVDAPKPIILNFTAVADAVVDEATPTTNYGSAVFLDVDGSAPRTKSFLRFSLSGLPKVQAARLFLYATQAVADGPAVHPTSGAWTESGVTWANAPGATGPASDDKGAVTASTWVEFDVTPLVTGNGTVNLVLQTTTKTGVEFSSRESSRPPRLMVVGTPP
ncbi:MAG: DNRLRE domain-containing protein [Deltaproteobacteria bacterium]|nr:DNRLRE domain-containing protein [Deltaproteobacteria bacterium]